MKRILIAGYGKMGSWLWSLLSGEYELAVYETNKELTKSVPEVLFLNTREDVHRFSPDIFVNCVSINHTIRVFSDMVSLLPPECILADIASVKGDLKEFYLNSGRRFVSLHPMFGPTFSDMSSPGGRTAYIISESDRKGSDLFRNCFEKVGIAVRMVDFDEHDKLMSTFLSVPVLSSLLFAAVAAEQAFAGTTYDRFSGIATGVMNENSDLLWMILKNQYTNDKVALMADTLNDIASVLNGSSESDFTRLISSLKDRSGFNPEL